MGKLRRILFTLLREYGFVGTCRRVWLYARHPGRRGVLCAVRRRLSSVGAVGAYPVARGSRCATSLLPEERAAIRSPEGYAVFFAHDSGGGAAAWLKRKTTTSVGKENPSAFVEVSFQLGSHLYHMAFCRKGGERVNLHVTDIEDCFALLDDCGLASLHYNSLANWPGLFRVLDFITERARSGIPLHFFVHDFFCLCPSLNLLNDKLHFCGLPREPAVCEQCLKRNSLTPLYSNYPLTEWRGKWHALLRECGTIGLADASVRDLLLTVYPDVAGHIVQTAMPPPAMVSALPVSGPATEPIILILGNIGVHKGALLVRDLCVLLEKRRPGSRVVVLGSLGISFSSPLLTVTGAYTHEELAELAGSFSPNVGLVPSVWPETFCYTAQEIRLFGLPLVTLDIGAQARQARDYNKGETASTPDAEGCCTAIMRAFEKERARREAERRR